MAFNQKRASSSSSSFAAGINPRRQSSYGHIMAGTGGGLPSAHTAAIKAAAAAAASGNGNSTTGNTTANTNGGNASTPIVTTTTSSSMSSGNKRLSTSGFSLRNTFYNSQHSQQHRNQSLKARVARTCPSLIHGSPRRRRNLFVMLCAGGVVVLIFFMSTLEVSLSPSTVLDRSSQQKSSSINHNINNGQGEPPQEQVVYRNPDGTEMDMKSIFMIRDFGLPACKASFESHSDLLPKEIRDEREHARTNGQWSITKQDAYTLSLSWKRSMKEILPNWKEYSPGWVGQGVVLAPFPDRDGQDTIPNTLVQIKLIRSMSSIPIEVWFETIDDVSEELYETLASWGAVIRTLDEDTSIIWDASVELSDEDENESTAVTPSVFTPIANYQIDELKEAVGRNRAQLQRGLTVAALTNSGFEDIIYYSPSTLPMQSPKSIFEQPDYIRTGAMFWQHPTAFAAHDNPIWRIAQVDCNPHTFQQSWSAIALKHKDAWKGLFLAWHWLSGSDHAVYEKLFGQQGHDLLRVAWMAVKRPYALVDRMPQAQENSALLDLSQSKGNGIGCVLGSSLYPTPGSDVLVNPVAFHQDQLRQQRQHRSRSSRVKENASSDFVPNRNVMMIDTALHSALTNAGSNDRQLHDALDIALNTSRKPTEMLLTDLYAAGSDGRVCLQILRRRRGHRHD